MAEQPTVPSHLEDAEEETPSVILSKLMDVMTKRLERLLAEQDERSTKLFNELFDERLQLHRQEVALTDSDVTAADSVVNLTCISAHVKRAKKNVTSAKKSAKQMKKNAKRPKRAKSAKRTKRAKREKRPTSATRAKSAKRAMRTKSAKQAKKSAKRPKSAKCAKCAKLPVVPVELTNEPTTHCLSR